MLLPTDSRNCFSCKKGRSAARRAKRPFVPYENCKHFKSISAYSTSDLEVYRMKLSSCHDPKLQPSIDAITAELNDRKKQHHIDEGVAGIL